MEIEKLMCRIWVGITNSLMIYLVWPNDGAGRQLNHAIGNLYHVSWVDNLREHPWLTAAVMTLACGIITELIRSRLAAIANVGYYGIALCVSVLGMIRDWHEVPAAEMYPGVVLYTIPVLIILMVDAYFYRHQLIRSHRVAGVRP